MDESARRQALREPLSWRGRLVVVVLLLTALGLGALVVKRAAFSDKPRSDAVVFFRAAWAVRSGEDIYRVTANWWHYHYPPLFAIAMTPLADPPEGVAREWMLPLWVSVGAWYLVSLLCGAVGVHWLAQACEEAEPRLAIGGLWSRGWWVRRLVPALVCLPEIGNTLVRGQVNLLLVLLIAGMVRMAVRRKWVGAGIWLAGAVCLKVIPAFLVVLPLWRSNWRWLAGCAAGLGLGLVAIPAVVLGPQRTWAYAQEWAEVLARPAMGGASDGSRDRELFDLEATGDQSIQGVARAWVSLGVAERTEQPRTIEGTRVVHLALGAALTLATLLIGGRREEPLVGVLMAGLLTSVMLMVTPVCHVHYFALALVLVTPLVSLGLACEEPGRRALGWWLWLSYAALNALPLLPGLQVLRQLGVPALAGLALWGAGLVVVRRVGRRGSVGLSDLGTTECLLSQSLQA
jgi:hypothetical protein